MDWIIGNRSRMFAVENTGLRIFRCFLCCSPTLMSSIIQLTECWGPKLTHSCNEALTENELISPSLLHSYYDRCSWRTSTHYMMNMSVSSYMLCSFMTMWCSALGSETISWGTYDTWDECDTSDSLRPYTQQPVDLHCSAILLSEVEVIFQTILKYSMIISCASAVQRDTTDKHYRRIPFNQWSFFGPAIFLIGFFAAVSVLNTLQRMTIRKTRNACNTVIVA
jgi:hypothetical protein